MSEGKSKIVTLKPYDYDVADDVFSVLFYGSDKETEDGYREIPAASYQLVVSALELFRWEVIGSNYDTLRKATAIVEMLRDKQKVREWKRDKEGL